MNFDDWVKLIALMSGTLAILDKLCTYGKSAYLLKKAFFQSRESLMTIQDSPRLLFHTGFNEAVTY